MRHGIVLVGCVLLLAGCRQAGSPCVRHTSFYQAHRADRYFREAAESQHSDVETLLPVVSTQCSSGDKVLCLSFKGDEEIRASVMRGYRQYVENELVAARLSVGERSVVERRQEGMLCDFHFDYCTDNNRTQGFIRASSAVDGRGHVNVEVHLFEYKGSP